MLARDVAGLLTAQRDRSSDLPYELFGTDAPALGEVYVRECVREASHDPDMRPGIGSSGAQAITSAHELVLKRPHAVVLGAPGSGKTSMVQRLVYRCSQAWLRPDGGKTVPDHRLLTLVPLWIKAADLTADGAFPDLLASALTRQLGARLDAAPDPAMFTRAPAPGADWLVCVDGLDEILDPGRRRSVVQALRWRLVNRGPYRFLITSRPLFLRELRPLYEAGAAYEILSFTDNQLSVFAERWFTARGRPEATAAFLAEIRQSPIVDLARVPLLATIAAVVHENREAARLPVTRTGLFEEFMRYLLHIRPAAVQARNRLVTSLAGYGSSPEALAEWLFDRRRPRWCAAGGAPRGRAEVRVRRAGAQRFWFSRQWRRCRPGAACPARRGAGRALPPWRNGLPGFRGQLAGWPGTGTAVSARRG